MKYFITLLTALIVFTSCEKDEIAIAKLDRGDIISQGTTKSTYANQLYFDLETNLFVKENKKTEWDIAFGCGDHYELILTNTSKSISVARKQNVTFNEVTTLDNLEFKFESSTGHPDSTAFHNWNYDDVFIIDLGYDEAGNAQGYGKIKLISNDETEVSFEYGLLEETQSKSVSIFKNDDYNAVFFSIKNDAIADIEPPKADWDICFTQYIYYFHAFETPYLVSGVMLNRSNVSTYIHKYENFAELTIDNVEPSDFSPHLDAIGYTWKVFDNTSYTVNDKINYIINSTEGFYYKLHFVDFYSDQGEKGFPKFEFQKI